MLKWFREFYTQTDPSFRGQFIMTVLVAHQLIHNVYFHAGAFIPKTQNSPILWESAPKHSITQKL